MADDADVPPLEDMTGVIKKAEAIREQQQKNSKPTNTPELKSHVIKGKESDDPKTRAKVTKKTGSSNVNLAPEKHVEVIQKETPTTTTTTTTTTRAKPAGGASNTSSQGMFGGMKKGFLFSSPRNASTSKSATSSSTAGSAAKNSQGSSSSCSNTNTTEMTKKNTTGEKKTKEEIPFIKPRGNAESGLALDEVQEAMSEVKGLLDDQEWITEDLLGKIEKNDTLLKRFSDQKFMSALQEFQTNPQAAMEKYKGNTEVEKFLLEFCGLLGDHFTNLGSTDSTPTKNQGKATPKPMSSVPVAPTGSGSSSKSATPKIIELGSGDEGAKNTSTVPEKKKVDAGKGGKSSVVLNRSEEKKPTPDILIHDAKNRADIQEVPVGGTDDDAVREVLNDPKVMETLMDAKVMNLIQALREDPARGQKIADEADKSLKEKIRFLVSKGLLQLQMN